VFGLLAVFLRRMLAETPVFEEMRRRDELVRGLPLRTVLAGHRAAVVVAMLLTWQLTAAIVVVILMTPSLIQQLFAIAPAQALAANSIATFALIVGCIGFGMLGDRIGAVRALYVGSLALAIAACALYAGVQHAPARLPLLYAIAGFCVGVVGVIPALLVREFPPRVRFSGISFAYNIAYAIFGGLTPLFVAPLARWAPLAPAYYVAALCVLGMAAALVTSRGSPSMDEA
jgi:MFS family permease